MTSHLSRLDEQKLSELCDTILETNTWEVFGPTVQDNSLENKDTYATGDARIPSILGGYTRRGKIKNKKRRKKSKKTT